MNLRDKSLNVIDLYVKVQERVIATSNTESHVAPSSGCWRQLQLAAEHEESKACKETIWSLIIIIIIIIVEASVAVWWSQFLSEAETLIWQWN